MEPIASGWSPRSPRNRKPTRLPISRHYRNFQKQKSSKRYKKMHTHHPVYASPLSGGLPHDPLCPGKILPTDPSAFSPRAPLLIRCFDGANQRPWRGNLDFRFPRQPGGRSELLPSSGGAAPVGGFGWSVAFFRKDAAVAPGALPRCPRPGVRPDLLPRPVRVSPPAPPHLPSLVLRHHRFEHARRAALCIEPHGRPAAHLFRGRRPARFRRAPIHSRVRRRPQSDPNRPVALAHLIDLSAGGLRSRRCVTS